MVPYLTQSVSALRRTGPFTWTASDEDPQFRFPLKLYRPRHLVLVLDGIDREVRPTLYFDNGQGFEEDASAEFQPAGRFVCRIELHAMPGVRRLRLDPFDDLGQVRLRAWATPSKLAANLLVRRLVTSRVPSGPTRVFTVREPILAGAAFGSGLERRIYRSTAEHLREVLDLPRPAVATPAEPLVTFLVPTFDTKPPYLDELLRSVRAQPAGLARIVFSDDGSSSAATLSWLDARAGEPDVAVLVGSPNRGIAGATNAALAAATTPWVAMLDHDDALLPGAVEMLARALAERPDAEFVYTDEVVATAQMKPDGYMLKPAFDPVLLSGANYINHLSFYRTERLRAIGGLRDGFQGSQDYDGLLRYLATVQPEHVVHVPYPAYLWRRHKASYSTARRDDSVESARRALAEAFGTPEHPVTVEPALSRGLHRVRFDLAMRRWPSVSVIVPNKDSAALLRPLLDGLWTGTDYPDLEVLVVDNGSTDPETLRLYGEQAAAGRRFEADIVPEPFNFARSINRGARLASGEVLVLLNNDVEVTEPNWLKEMVSCLSYDGTGIVGARLLYPDRTLQHAGVIVGAGGLAGHWFEKKPETYPGPLGRLGVRQTMTAVTGAVMLISRTCFDAVGPWDEERFAVAYNDVDYCLRAREAGFRTVWTPFATLIHHESASRGSDRTAANADRFKREQRHLQERHRTAAFSDPASNPWYTRDRSTPGLRQLSELPGPR